MFVFHPATRRIGENAAIDEVGTPVLIVDDAGRIINLNEVAEERFDLAKYEVLGQRASTVVEGDPVDPENPGAGVSLLVEDEWREYDVTSTPLQDESARRIGYTVTLHDVTAERQRKQRLQVLNRVLRHNLRNDLSVVTSSVEAIRAQSDDERVADLSETVVSTCRGLIDMGEEARLLDDVLGDGENARERVDLERTFERVAEDLRGEWPEGRIVVEDGTGATVETDPRLLSETLRAAVENGLEHNDTGGPTVWLSAGDDGDVTEIRVRDNGPGIPDHERAVVETGRETELEHGSGLGLWLIAWCVRRLGGKVSFEVDGGTTVVVRLPRRPGGAGDERSTARTTGALEED
jgi:signal transduction histidine kinase